MNNEEASEKIERGWTLSQRHQDKTTKSNAIYPTREEVSYDEPSRMSLDATIPSRISKIYRGDNQVSASFELSQYSNTVLKSRKK